MMTMKSKLKSVQEVGMHERACLFFKNNLEFFHCLIPFIREAIKNNEKCLIVLNDLKREDVLRSFASIFREGYIPPKEFSNNEHIIINQIDDIYLFNGTLSVEETYQNYSMLLEKTMYENYSGLRILSEFSSIITQFPLDILTKFESNLKGLFEEKNLLTVCCYNKNYIIPDSIKRLSKIYDLEVDLLKTRL